MYIQTILILYACIVVCKYIYIVFFYGLVNEYVLVFFMA